MSIIGDLLGPTFLVVGAGKAGTTSLYSALAAHPDIYGAQPKEIRFFSNFWKEGEAWYLEHFRDGQTHRHRFEASPQYSFCTEFANVPKRIFEFNADMRILYIVRDPIARIVSHFTHWNRTLPDRYVDINEALTDPTMRQPLIDRTKYWMQLKPYLDLFGINQVACLTLEDLAADYTGTVNSIFRFLGIDENCQSPAPISNKSPLDRLEHARTELSDRLLDQIASELADDTQQILKFIGKSPDFWSCA